MNIANQPCADTAGSRIDTLKTGKYASHNTHNCATSKGNLRASRNDAPFAELVVPYFMTHPNNTHLNIYCGPEGIKKAEQDANDCRNFGFCPSLCLPTGDEYKNFWWPVKNLTVVLNWDCEDVGMQIEFSNYLAHVCKARCVFTLLNGVSTKFMNASKLTTTNGIAA